MARTRRTYQISIHAPHAGSDARRSCHILHNRYFNPRPPCGERRRIKARIEALKKISIHAPHAGSDFGGCRSRRADSNFNPRPPCGERRLTVGRWYRGDVFQSTPPMRGATCQLFADFGCIMISIHAPHAGSDSVSASKNLSVKYFNPRPPCGERPTQRLLRNLVSIFQSTPPMRGATDPSMDQDGRVEFQSTPPMRGATSVPSFNRTGNNISIHAPHAGSDLTEPMIQRRAFLFQSTPPMRGATLKF